MAASGVSGHPESLQSQPIHSSTSNLTSLYLSMTTSGMTTSPITTNSLTGLSFGDASTTSKFHLMNGSNYNSVGATQNSNKQNNPIKSEMQNIPNVSTATSTVATGETGKAT